MAKTGKKFDYSKQDFGQLGMDLALGLGGGIVANQAANFLEKQEFMQGKEEFVPLIPVGLGLVGYFLLPPNLKSLAFGMFVVSGTEEAETLIAKGTGAMAGLMDSLGFTPQFTPASRRPSIIKSPQGSMVRG